MNDEAAVYDLGEVKLDDMRPRKMPSSVASHPRHRRRELRGNAVGDAGSSSIQKAWPVSFALFIPGAGHILRGEFRRGMFYLASMGFLGALCWAVLATLDRLSATFTVLGLPPEIGLWALGVIFILAAITYVGSVCGAVPSGTPSDPLKAPRPLVSGIASLLIPGWGQALVRHRVRTALFLSGCWLVGGAWILVSPPVQALIDSQGLYLPRALVLLGSPLVRWTLPAILWTLAVYDAAFQATWRR
jgi:hypothetical protein